ncbi:MAG: DNA circularization N-terminal domain-containing protein [Microbispora sp.]|nr:DNA circularization N-terminal domain-containing protein [Microbispora sp.]
MSSWTEGLRPASFRGVPFSVLSAEAGLARRTAVHEYPFRDDVWVEDLGGGRNTFGLTGFLVGDDVISLRDDMQAAAQTPGPGELIHPTFGSLTVACVDFRTAERWDAGRVIELSFAFVRAGERLYPGSDPATGDAVRSAADAADQAASGDFVSRIGATLRQGGAAINGVISTAQKYGGMAQRLVGDATRVLHSVGGMIPGMDRVFSRYLSGARRFLGQIGSDVGTARGFINGAATTRSAVDRAAADLTRAANSL